jgi:hypothetical protein
MEQNAHEDEVAAALAAVSLYLEAEQAGQQQPSAPWQWVATRTMMIQGVPVTRIAAPPGWSNIERLRRAGKGGTGITGL